MKTKITILVVLIFFLLPVLKAQETEVPGHAMPSPPKQDPAPLQKPARVIKTNPLAMIWGPIPFTSEYRVIYEFITSRHQSSQVGFSFLGKSPILTLMEDSLFLVPVIVRGYRFQASHRFFLSGILEAMGSRKIYSPVGIFISPHISYSTARITPRRLSTYDIYMRISHFNVNLLSGAQFFIKEKISFEIFMGLGYKNNTWIFRHSPTQVQNLPLEDVVYPYYRGPIKLNFGFNVGMGF